jgi:hypothetical protein
MPDVPVAMSLQYIACTSLGPDFTETLEPEYCALSQGEQLLDPQAGILQALPKKYQKVNPKKYRKVGEVGPFFNVTGK